MNVVWRARPWPEPSELLPLVEALGVHPLVAAALHARGFRTREDLAPPLRPWRPPAMARAAATLVEAIEKGRRIRVHGDYDADGITGTAILVKGLAELGADVHPFIPTRDEGYGVSAERIPEHAEAADVFVTVDCGITNHAELKSLVEDGVAVVVTDHHHPGKAPPPGTVVHPAYDPALEDRPKPTGAGVAFFLLWEVRRLLEKEPPLAYADLAAVGTIADVAPLLGLNRALVQAGLARVRGSAHLGLRLLAERLLTRGTAIEVAFRVAPRINAAGRLGEPMTALRLLLTEDLFEARELADRLDRLNAERQRIEEAMLARVLPTLDPEDPAHVVHDPEGHPGVMGIVASRILERTGKPVFIIAKGKGSVRSPAGVSAVEALRAAAEHLLGFGGHAQAAGFSIEEEKIPAFREAIHAYVRAHPPRPPEILLDGPLFREELAEVWPALLELEPIGEGNPEPLFYLRGRPERVKPLAEGRHVSFFLGGVRVVRWRDAGEGLSGEVEVAAGVVLHEWNGEKSLELRAEAYRPPQGVRGSGSVRLKVVRQELREALAEVVADRIPSFAEGEGAAWLRERGVPVVAPAEAEYWFAVPEACFELRPVVLALGDQALKALARARVSRAGFREAQRRRTAGLPLPPPYDRVLAEAGDDPYRSPTYRALLVLTAYARRLAWAYRAGDDALLAEALVGYRHALCQLERL